MKAPKPLRRAPALRLPLVLAGLAAMQAVAAAEPEPEFIPGHPWTTVVPDPDKFDWSAQVRPGYRYRGMTPNAERAYKYIQDKRARGVALNWGERYMVRFLQSARVWPEPPMPPPAVIAFLRHRPDVALVDLRMPDVDGADAIATIRERVPSARLIVLTTYDDDEDIQRSLPMGAKACMFKDAPREELLACIHAVHEGGTLIPPALGRREARGACWRPLTHRP